MSDSAPQSPPTIQGEPSGDSREKAEIRRNVLKALLLAGLLAAALALVRFSPLGDYLKISNIGLLQQTLAQFQCWAPLVFLLGGAVVISLGAPRSLISVLGGVIFGLWSGVLLALAAALLGSVGIFMLTKRLGRPLFKQKIGSYLEIIEAQSRENGFMVVILLRQLPLTCILVNVLIGLTPISTGTFLLGSIVGLLPETIIFALFGSSLQQSFILRVSLASFLLVLFVLIGKIYYQRSQLGRAVAKQFRNGRS